MNLLAIELLGHDKTRTVKGSPRHRSFSRQLTLTFRKAQITYSAATAEEEIEMSKSAKKANSETVTVLAGAHPRERIGELSLGGRLAYIQHRTIELKGSWPDIVPQQSSLPNIPHYVVSMVWKAKENRNGTLTNNLMTVSR